MEKAYGHFSRQGIRLLTNVSQNPEGSLKFYLSDPFDNIFEIIEDNYWFKKKGNLIGGVCGATIGVSNMNAATGFYRDVLSYNVLSVDKENTFPDFKGLPDGEGEFRRVLMKHRSSLCGPFSKLLGPSSIELIQAKTTGSQKIYSNRYWGDPGFIHICYDLSGMNEHAKICNDAGWPLTVNSMDSFAMGNAAGHFAYNEDPDGTLIEYVETHKVPILKKLGWYLDLRKRNNTKPLPDWMIRCMGLGKKIFNYLTDLLIEHMPRHKKVLIQNKLKPSSSQKINLWQYKAMLNRLNK